MCAKGENAGAQENNKHAHGGQQKKMLQRVGVCSHKERLKEILRVPTSLALNPSKGLVSTLVDIPEGGAQCARRERRAG